MTLFLNGGIQNQVGLKNRSGKERGTDPDGVGTDPMWHSSDPGLGRT